MWSAKLDSQGDDGFVRGWEMGSRAGVVWLHVRAHVIQDGVYVCAYVRTYVCVSRNGECVCTM